MTFLKTLLVTFFAFGSFYSLSQNSLNLPKVEQFILDGRRDSAKIILSNSSLSADKTYGKLLTRISDGETLKYTEYQSVFSNLGMRQYLDQALVYSFYQESVLAPTQTETIEYDYVFTSWMMISKLRDAEKIELASLEQENLDRYIDQFDPDLLDVKRSKILASTHEIVLCMIQEKIEKGMEMAIQNEKSAIEIKDTNLLIIALYYQCEFLTMTGKLDLFISLTERSLALEHDKVKSLYYTSNLIHLVDALLYKGGSNARVKELLNQMFHRSSSRSETYSLYGKYLSTVNPSEKSTYSDILARFEAPDVSSLCDTFARRGTKELNPLSCYYIYLECARALSNFGESDKVISYMQHAVNLSRSTYSAKLAQSLANYETRIVNKENDVIKREKQLQTQNQKEQIRLFVIIMSLLAAILIIIAISLSRARKRRKALSIKNLEIEEKNELLEKNSEEKSLLLKEIHHRVKNNFQIVSSLLELQMRGIDDEKSLQLMQEGQNRVKSMAIIHQKLYQNDELRIEMGDYTRQLVQEIKSMYLPSGTTTNFDISSNFILDIDTAIPLGLIINELITNACKYGLKGLDNGHLDVSLQKGVHSHELIIADNGSGMDEGIDINQAKSLGLRLVRRLSKQLKGKMEYMSKNGARFTIHFKELHRETEN